MTADPLTSPFRELTLDLYLPPDDAHDATVIRESVDLDGDTVEDRTVVMKVPDALLFRGFSAMHDAALLDEIDTVNHLETSRDFEADGCCGSVKRVASGLLAARATADLVAQEDGCL